MEYLIQKKTGGFSLIEMILYSALLGGLLAITLLSVYPLFRSIEIQNEHNVENIEALFIAQKTIYLMSNMKEVTLPLLNTSSSELTTTTYAHETHRMKQAGSVLLLSIDSDPFLSITSSHVVVNNFRVFHKGATATTSEMLEITYTLSGHTYGPIRKYLE